MAGGWLDHKQLSIIKGIGKTPGDSTSAEADPVVVNLMSGAITLDEWTPNIPAVKNSGIWSDSPLSDGRTLLAAPMGNVTEKISIIIRDNSYLGAQKQLSNLNQMVTYCRDFWQSQGQIDPVYLAWWAGCGAGSQYALIYNVEIAPEYMDSPSPTIRASLSIEREFGWRGIPPGANPKLWTLGTQFKSSSANLATGSDHLVNKTIQNKREWNTTQTAELTNNYVDIPAALIPGDLPALVALGTDSIAGANPPDTLYCGRSTKPTSMNIPGGGTSIPILMLNAGDAFGGPPKAADTGAPKSNSLGTGQRIDMTGTGLIVWDSVNSKSKIDMATMRGQYICFARVRLSAAATVSNVAFSISYNGSNRQTLPSVQVTSVGGGGVGNTTSWAAIYLGQLSVPFSSERVPTTLTGLGTSVAVAGQNTIEIDLDGTLVSGLGHLYICDVILIPMDEACFAVNAATLGTRVLIDSTGYANHGQTEVGVINAPNGVNVNQNPYTFSGQTLTLIPHVNNRLHFFGTNANTSNIETAWDIRLNIVPRWAGIRDV